MDTILATSRQYVRARVTAPTGVDPTGDSVKLALIGSDLDQPTAADWQAGSWEPVDTPGVYVARVLVGPGTTLVLTPDIYRVYAQVTDIPEAPEVLAGQLRVI